MVCRCRYLSIIFFFFFVKLIIFLLEVNKFLHISYNGAFYFVWIVNAGLTVEYLRRIFAVAKAMVSAKEKQEEELAKEELVKVELAKMELAKEELTRKELAKEDLLKVELINDVAQDAYSEFNKSNSSKYRYVWRWWLPFDLKYTENWI